MKVSSSENWLLAAAVEVAVRTVALPNLLLFRWCSYFLVLFRLLLIASALIEDDKFISVNGYTSKLSYSLTVFHHVLVLLLRYNCDWGTLTFNKLLSMGSYDFVTAYKFGKNGWPFFGPLFQNLDFFGLDLAPWKKVDLATLLQVTAAGVLRHVTRAPTEVFFHPDLFFSRPVCLGLIVKIEWNLCFLKW